MTPGQTGHQTQKGTVRTEETAVGPGDEDTCYQEACSQNNHLESGTELEKSHKGILPADNES